MSLVDHPTDPKNLEYIARHCAAWTPAMEAALQRKFVEIGLAPQPEKDHAEDRRDHP